MQPTRILARHASRTLSLLARHQLRQQRVPAMAAAVAATRSNLVGNNRAGFATSLPFGDFQKNGDVIDKAQEYMDEGIRFMDNNMIPLAMSSFQRSLNERPTAAAHYNMGVGYFQMGDYRSAIRSFQESLKLAPHHADVHTNLATAHIKLDKDFDSALHHLKAAADISPKDAEIQFNLAVVCEQTGDLDAAIKGYKAALDLGIETASVNLRNVSAKKLAKMVEQQKQQPTEGDKQ
ncbi:hypothetical protein BGW41_003941 [Actinomortierella wolfii]|nr:hypothetical protein BGW41_003941 [Actinomortierella wolfii]